MHRSRNAPGISGQTWFAAIALTAAFVPAAPAINAQAGHELRVGVVWPRDPELRGGVEFGIAEARRSMALFGWHLEIDTLVPPAGGDRVHAIVSEDASPGTSHIPLVLLSCVSGARAFIVAACPPSAAVEWHPRLERYGAGQLNDRFRAATGHGMSAAAWRGWFAMKALSESAMRARDPSRVGERLRHPATQFDGHKGVPLRFDSQGGLVQPLYEVIRDSSGAEAVRERSP